MLLTTGKPNPSDACFRRCEEKTEGQREDVRKRRTRKKRQGERATKRDRQRQRGQKQIDRDKDRERGTDRQTGEVHHCTDRRIPNKQERQGRTEGLVVVCWLLNVLAPCYCILGIDLLRQFYVLPYIDKSGKSNFLFHPVTVF